MDLELIDVHPPAGAGSYTCRSRTRQGAEGRTWNEIMEHQMPSALSTTQFLQLVKRLHDPQDPKVIVVAHRGLYLIDEKLRAPENTVANLQACIDRGLDCIELDIRTTRDNRLVLFHESRMGRMTGVEGNIEKTPWSEVQKLRLRYRSGAMSEEPVTLLEDFLNAARDHILLKLHPKIPHEAYADLFELLRRTSTSQQSLVWMDEPPGSSELNELANLMQKLPGSSDFKFLLNITAPEHVKEVKETWHPHAVEIAFDHPEDMNWLPAAVQEAKAFNAKVSINCQGTGKKSAGICDQMALQNPDEGWGRFVDFGFDLMQTNEPEPLAQYLHGKGKHE